MWARRYQPRVRCILSECSNSCQSLNDPSRPKLTFVKESLALESDRLSESSDFGSNLICEVPAMVPLSLFARIRPMSSLREGSRRTWLPIRRVAGRCQRFVGETRCTWRRCNGRGAQEKRRGSRDRLERDKRTRLARTLAQPT